MGNSCTSCGPQGKVIPDEETLPLTGKEEVRAIVAEPSSCPQKCCKCCGCCTLVLVSLALFFLLTLVPGLPLVFLSTIWCHATRCLDVFDPQRGAHCQECGVSFTRDLCWTPTGANTVTFGYIIQAGLPECRNVIQDHVVRWDDVWEQGSEYPAKQWSGEWWRGNELGYLMNSPYFWSGSGIWPNTNVLGATPKQHAAVRPFLVEMFGGEVSEDARDWIRQSAREFLAHRRAAGKFVVKTDTNIWMHQVLSKAAFDKNVPYAIAAKEASTASDFAAVQDAAVLLGVALQALPAWSYPLLRMATLGETLQKVDAYIASYAKEVEKRWGSRLDELDCAPSPNCTVQLASAVWDAFYSAGGLSVPQTIACGLGVLYSTSDSNPAKGFEVPKGQELDFYWEVVRFYPPVVGFPHWEKRPSCWREGAESEGEPMDDAETEALNKPHGKSEACPKLPASSWTGYPPENQWQGGHRVVLSLPHAQRDKKKWGPDADQFLLRPLSEYRKYSVGFAEMAVDPEVVDGAMDRKCPAKQLALEIGAVFFQEFDQKKWKATDTDITLASAKASLSVSSFTLEPVDGPESA